MNKRNLKLNDTDFNQLQIVGIVSQENDVRLCWLIGQTTGISLSRTDNYGRAGHNQTHNFARYVGNLGPEEILLVLLQNKTRGQILFESARQFDYIILSTNELTGFAHFCEQLKKISEIQAIYPLEQATLKGISEAISL